MLRVKFAEEIAKNMEEVVKSEEHIKMFDTAKSIEAKAFEKDAAKADGPSAEDLKDMPSEMKKVCKALMQCADDLEDAECDALAGAALALCAKVMKEGKKMHKAKEDADEKKKLKTAEVKTAQMTPPSYPKAMEGNAEPSEEQSDPHNLSAAITLSLLLNQVFDGISEISKPAQIKMARDKLKPQMSGLQKYWNNLVAFVNEK